MSTRGASTADQRTDGRERDAAGRKRREFMRCSDQRRHPVAMWIKHRELCETFGSALIRGAAVSAALRRRTRPHHKKLSFAHYQTYTEVEFHALGEVECLIDW